VSDPIQFERAVGDRYSKAAKAREAKLCCSVEYDSRLLEVIPQEILERDYGCGDPTRHLQRGETVLDLGSGGGKVCYIASQIVGPEGRVIGVDMNDAMLALAESHRQSIGNRLGYHNVSFLKGKIQDLPLADGTVDVIVSNCVLNLVRPQDKRRLFHEMFRVLRRGGRAVISDIVSDEQVPEAMQRDPELWSGCISGAFREDALLAAFEEAGFDDVRILRRDAEPWQVIDGIEFRALTVRADRQADANGRTDEPCCGPGSDCG